MKDDIVVSIICCCYNQKEYIKSCLEGFISQKTNFKYEVLIHDDASDDGTIELLEEYQIRFPDIITLFKEEHNRYNEPHISYAYEFGLLHAKGKYVAICEGDDCWINPNKLQIEIDYLESNTSCGLVYTDAIAYNVSKQKFIKNTIAYKCEDLSTLLAGNGIPTATVCFRKSLGIGYFEEVKPWLKGWKMGDYPLWLWISERNGIKYIPDITTCYRELEESASHTKDKDKRLAFEKSIYDIRKFFLMRGSVPENKVDDYYLRYRYARYELEQGYTQMKAREMREYINKSKVSSNKLSVVYVASLSKWLFNIYIKALKFVNGAKYVDKPDTGIPNMDVYAMCAVGKVCDEVGL